MNRKTRTLAAAVAVALGASAFSVAAQDAPARATANTLDTVIVTGTRVADRTVAESLCAAR